MTSSHNFNQQYQPNCLFKFSEQQMTKQKMQNESTYVNQYT